MLPVALNPFNARVHPLPMLEDTPQDTETPNTDTSPHPEDAPEGVSAFAEGSVGEAPSVSEPVKALSPQALARLRRREKIKRLWQARLQEVLRFLVFIGLFYGVFVWLNQPYWRLSPQQVDVEGHRMMQASRLKQALKNEWGTHILALNPAQVSKTLASSDPLVARIQVRRLLWPRPHVVIRVSEHRPWGLVYNPWEKASVLAWHRQANEQTKGHTNGQGMVPAPYAFVLDSYKSLHFTQAHYQLPKQALAQRYTFMFMDTQAYRRLSPQERQQRLEHLDRIIEGVRQIKGVDVESLTLSNRQHLQLDVTLEGHSVVVVAGLLDAGIFKRLARLKPALKKIHDLNEASPHQVIDRVDVSWNENLYLRRATR